MAIPDAVINTILAEAGGSGPAGMSAVAHVIANRAAQRGLTPEQVVSQPHQFEGYSNPSPGGLANEANPALRALAEQVWNGVANSPDPTGGALNYYGDYASPPSWARNAPYGTINIGGNVFIPQAPTALGYSSPPPVPRPVQAINAAAPTPTVPIPAPMPATLSPDVRESRLNPLQRFFDSTPLGHVVQAAQGIQPNGGLLGMLMGGNNGGLGGLLGGLFGGGGNSSGGGGLLAALGGSGGGQPANFYDAGPMGLMPTTDIHGNPRNTYGDRRSGTNSNGSLV